MTCLNKNTAKNMQQNEEKTNITARSKVSDEAFVGHVNYAVTTNTHPKQPE